MLHIGIVACSAEGAALCYRTICTEAPAALGGHEHPQISLHGHSLQAYVECLERGDWDGVAELMADSAERLARAGAAFAICPDNTIHTALPLVEPRSPIPWLHIADVVAGEAARRGFRNAGLLGTKWLVASEVYPERLARRGTGCVRPTQEQRYEIDRIIMDELVRGVRRPESVAYVRRTIDDLRARGCDTVILGCTELPLVVDDANSALPVLDSTRLLARAALEHATSG